MLYLFYDSLAFMTLKPIHIGISRHDNLDYFIFLINLRWSEDFKKNY